MIGKTFDIALLLALTVVLQFGILLGAVVAVVVALLGYLAWLAMHDTEEGSQP